MKDKIISLILVIFIIHSCEPPIDVKLKVTNKARYGIFVRSSFEENETDSLIAQHSELKFFNGDYIKPGEEKKFPCAYSWETKVDESPDHKIYIDVFSSDSIYKFVDGYIKTKDLFYFRYALTKNDLERINWDVEYRGEKL